MVMSPELRQACKTLLQVAYDTFQDDELSILLLTHELVVMLLRNADRRSTTQMVAQRWRDTVGLGLVAGLRAERYASYRSALERVCTLAVGPDLRLMKKERGS